MHKGSAYHLLRGWLGLGVGDDKRLRVRLCRVRWAGWEMTCCQSTSGILRKIPLCTRMRVGSLTTALALDSNSADHAGSVDVTTRGQGATVGVETRGAQEPAHGSGTAQGRRHTHVAVIHAGLPVYRRIVFFVGRRRKDHTAQSFTAGALTFVPPQGAGTPLISSWCLCNCCCCCCCCRRARLFRFGQPTHQLEPWRPWRGAVTGWAFFRLRFPTGTP